MFPTTHPYLYTLIAKPEDLADKKKVFLGEVHFYRLPRNQPIPDGYVAVTHIFGKPVYDPVTHLLMPKYGAYKRWKIDK